MRSPTSSEDSRLVRIVVPCAQTWHKRGCQGLGAIEMHSRAQASSASAARFDRPARQATEPRVKREVMSALCHGLVVDSTFQRSENVAITRQLLLACNEWCGLHLRMRAVLTGTRLYNSVLLVVFSHIIP